MIIRCMLVITLACLNAQVYAQPVKSIDLATTATNTGEIQRVYGSVGNGRFGVPVAGGFDMNDDGFLDYAFSSMVASPSGRSQAGQVFLILGDGTVNGEIDTALVDARVLPFIGDQTQEVAGSEIWMDDVTGDGLGDLLICRQNHSPPGKIGAGALTIIPGQSDLLDCANGNLPFDLRSPPSCLNATTLFGANAGDRLCMWTRTGQVAGDATADIVIGADRQTAINDDEDAGAIYLIRGGAHLNIENGGSIDLANFGSTALPGQIARVRPIPTPFPVGNPDTDTVNYHFGATVQIADLDANGTGEVIVAAALNRAGGVLPPENGEGEGSGGSPEGTVYILWDDNFGGDWSETAPDFLVGSGPGSHTIIDGGTIHDAFGEELLGGLDYNDDGNADLFVGDLTADGLDGIVRTNAGTGHIFYNAALLKNTVFDYDGTLPAGVTRASFIGPIAGAISGDTAMHGDFNNDGIDDLAFSSPHDEPFGRVSAGALHIFLGQDSNWPENSDLALSNFPDESLIKIINVYGANGQIGLDRGDTLAYSGTAGDLNGDGAVDILINEMVGNGASPNTVDVGNLLILDGSETTDLTPPPESDFFCWVISTQNDTKATICL